jgi:tetratricopeptide (TPR) repeat protein
MGEMFLEAGQTAQAAEKFRQMIELEPDNATGYALNARAAMLQSDWNQAIESLETVLALDPNWEDVHGLYGEALLHAGRYADAKLQFEAQLFSHADDLAAMMGLGMALLEMGQARQASQYFSKVIARRPEDPSGYFHMALCQFAQGKIHAGIALCLRTIQIDPRHLHALQQLVLAYGRLGRWSQARKVLDHALKAYPLDPALTHLKREWWYSKTLWLVRQVRRTLTGWFHR